MKILVVDVGGNNLKISISGRTGDPIKVPSGPEMTAAEMAAAVRKVAKDWPYDRVSIGYPGPVVHGRPSAEPFNLGAGWMSFDFKKAFGKPVRVVNDAAMQALGSYEGGRMLFLGLGTGLGSALVVEGVVAPLELAHLPYRDGRSYEDYAGERGLKRLGRKKWSRHVHRIVALLQHGLQCDYVILGGGQAKRLEPLPRGVRVGDNAKAILGGIRLWDHGGPARGLRLVADSPRTRVQRRRPRQQSGGPTALAGEDAPETPSDS